MMTVLEWMQGMPPVTQALVGTLFTWLMTALGAATIFLSRRPSRKLQDGMLGFAAGVMIAASYWSLLAPAIELSNGSWVPAVVGFLLGAAALRTPVVLDGVIAGSAALVAAALSPQARDYWFAGHVSAEPASRLAATDLGLRPLLDLGMRLGEGSGAVLAVPVIQAAARIVHEGATFASAGVAGRDE